LAPVSCDERAKIQHLRQRELVLKQQDLVVGPLMDPVSITNKPVQGGERRKDVRFSVSASAEMLEVRTRARLVSRASDLGTGGCYIDTMTPFPVGASLMLNLTSDKHNVHVKANVVYAQTGMGMGLAFTEITAKQRENLTAWLRERRTISTAAFRAQCAVRSGGDNGGTCSTG
jgi:PilZ domain